MKEDLTGKTFGQLTLIKPVPREGSRKRFWLCSCTCGAQTIAEESHLKSGHTKSCGCYRRIQPRKRQHDLTGRRYGRLLVLGPVVEDDGSIQNWECLCDCGKNCANNTTGHRGVYRRANNRWRAAIGFQGKIHYLGTFDRYEDAVQARLEAEENLYDAFLDRYRKGQCGELHHKNE